MPKSAQKWLLIFAGANIIVGGWFFGLTYFHREVTKWEALATDGRLVDATITRFDTNKGGEVSFEYEIDGTTYQGWSRSYAASLLSSSAVGARVKVWYLPQNPNVAVYDDPPSRLKKEWKHVSAVTGLSLFIFVWFPSAIALIVLRKGTR